MNSYYLPKARTTYEKLNVCFGVAYLWNFIQEDLKLVSHSCFKKLKNLLSPNTDWFFDALYLQLIMYTCSPFSFSFFFMSAYLHLLISGYALFNLLSVNQ